tara:strand:- start:582 stop:812 length:231 start_codon:yes stop_codon:yes gene_type:complete
MAFKLKKPIMFSTEGYKKDSPDVNNEKNIILGNSITMEDVEFPVHGVDSEGNEKIMKPGKNYKFTGDYVIETRLDN